MNFANTKKVINKYREIVNDERDSATPLSENTLKDEW